MAKVTLTFEDADDGSVKVRLEFDEPLSVIAKATQAQSMAIVALRAAQALGEESDDSDD